MNDIAARASRAQQLLDDPLLKEAFAVVVNEAIADWLRTPENAVDARERLYRQVVAVDRLRGHLKSLLDDSKIAERNAAAQERIVSRP